DAASRRDSSVIARRSRSVVGSAATLCLRLLPAVGAVLAVLGLAADELGQDLVALVVELLVDADLGGVVAVDGRAFGDREERLQGQPARRGVGAPHVAHEAFLEDGDLLLRLVL